MLSAQPTSAERPGDAAVRFVPSRVDGRQGVDEVGFDAHCVWLHDAGGWQKRDYEQPGEPTVQSGLARWLRLRCAPRVIGEMSFSKERYTDSFVRLLAEPQITIYMPSNEPTIWPHSHFWKLQKVIDECYRLHDLAYGPRPDPMAKYPLRGRPVLATVFVLFFLNWFIFFIVSTKMGGNALGIRPSDKGFVVSSKGRLTQVSERAWVVNLVYSTVSLIIMPLTILVGAYAVLTNSASRRAGQYSALPMLMAIVLAALVTYVTLRDFSTAWTDWRTLSRQVGR